MNRKLPSVIVALLLLTLASCHQGEGPPVPAPPNPAPTPTLKYVKDKERGCGNVHLIKATANGLEVLWISVTEKDYHKPLAKGSKTYDLSAAPEGVKVGVDLWKKGGFGCYCTDVKGPDSPIAKWMAKKGKLTITISEPPVPREPGQPTYRASARLESVLFEDGAGNQATLEVETFTDVRVGWFPG